MKSKLLMVYGCILFLVLSIFSQSALADIDVVPNGIRFKFPKGISAYIEMKPSIENVIYTVPEGKIFVLTDLMIDDLYGKTIILMENDVDKAWLEFASSMHLNSGIPFAPGTEVRVRGNDWLTITGYLLGN